MSRANIHTQNTNNGSDINQFMASLTSAFETQKKHDPKSRKDLYMQLKRYKKINLKQKTESKNTIDQCISTLMEKLELDQSSGSSSWLQNSDHVDTSINTTGIAHEI
jgi:hypothetical protein